MKKACRVILRVIDCKARWSEAGATAGRPHTIVIWMEKDWGLPQLRAGECREVTASNREVPGAPHPSRCVRLRALSRSVSQYISPLNTVLPRPSYNLPASPTTHHFHISSAFL